MIVAIVAGTVVSATIGPLSLRLGNVITRDELPHVWRTWWLGDISGALIVVPLAIAWYRPGGRRAAAAPWVEAVLVVVAVAG